MVLFRFSIGFLILFSVLHVLALPLIVSTDGRSYITLSAVLFSDSFPEQWNFARTPLFPLMIKFAFRALGENPEVIEFLNSLYLIGGILILGQLVRREVGPYHAALVITLLTLYPALTGFAHNVLTEVGTFFFITLVLVAAVKFPLKSDLSARQVIVSATIVGLAIGLGYYFRQTILYLVIPIGIFSCVFPIAAGSKSRLRLQYRLLYGATLCLIAWLTILPWKRLGGDSSFARTVLAIGFVKQGVVPTDTDYLAPVRNQYEQGLKEREARGLRGISGMAADVTRLVYNSNKSKIERQVYDFVRENPTAYMHGVFRSLLYFAGAPAYESQINIWTTSALTAGGTKVTGGDQKFSRRFKSVSTSSWLRSFVDFFVPVYRLLVPLGTLATIVLLVMGFFRKHFPDVLITSFALFFIVVHSLTCLTIDRYVLPIYPLVLVSLVLLPVRFLNRGSTNPSGGR